MSEKSVKAKIDNFAEKFTRYHGKTFAVMNNPPPVSVGSLCWADIEPGEKGFSIAENHQYGTVVDAFGNMSFALVVDGKAVSLSGQEMFDLSQWSQRNALASICAPMDGDQARSVFSFEAANKLYLEYIKSQPGMLWDFIEDEAAEALEKNIRAELDAEQQVLKQKALNDGAAEHRENILKLARAASSQSDTERDEILESLVPWIKSIVGDGGDSTTEH